MNKKYIDYNSDSIAVIGMACRFPGAKNIDEFWNNIKNGVESISFFSENEIVKNGADASDASNPALVKAYGLLEDADKFDAEFFGFSPGEAELLDPQCRIFLECAWEAVENASCNTDKIRGRAGIYASSSLSVYLLRNLLSNKERIMNSGSLFAQLGNDKDHVPTRTAYALNLTGPALAVGTACSSSLVAIHLACQGLLDYHCDIALAGGVTVHANQVEGYYFNPEGIASPDGHCRSFDSKAEGAISGSGVGVVVLKRLEDAVKDNDFIYAVVLSSAVNNDGAKKVSYTAPGVDGQSSVISEAQSIAEITPQEISYIEAHGTGTKMGDPIEIASLKKVFGRKAGKEKYCAIGSVKSNVGHLDSAAGIAGFIKTALSLKNKQIPPSLHYENANPLLLIEESPFYINRELKEWKIKGKPRIAGVSSFAMGGTNAHVILREAEECGNSTISNSINIIPVSAKNEKALEMYIKNIVHTINGGHYNINEIAYTYQIGRRHYKYRKAIVARNAQEYISETEKEKSQRCIKGIADSENNEIVFMFTGLGSQYKNMGLNLYNNNKIFNKYVNKCSEIFNKITGSSLIDIIYPDGTEEDENTVVKEKNNFLRMTRGEEKICESELLNKTVNAHAAIFAIDYSLAKMFCAMGIKPAALIGHSIGEYAAFCFAEVLSLENAMRLIIERANILETSPDGGMITIDAPKDAIKEYLDDEVAVSAVNDYFSCVVSGSEKALQIFCEKLEKAKIVYRKVNVQKAFHSNMLFGKKNELRALFAKYAYKKPVYPIITNVTGTWLNDAEIQNPEHWTAHSIGEVKFYEGIRKLYEEGYENYLETGPGQNLAGFVIKSKTGLKANKIKVFSAMKNQYDLTPDNEYFLKTVARLWVNGIEPDWNKLYNEEEKPKRIPLPSYPFQHKRYWIDEKRSNVIYDKQTAEAGVNYATWKKLPIFKIDCIKNKYAGKVLVIGFNEDYTKEILDILKTQGVDFTFAELITEDNKKTESEYAIKANNKKSYEALVQKITREDGKINDVMIITSKDEKSNNKQNIISEPLIITEIIKILKIQKIRANISFILQNAFSINGEEIIKQKEAALYGFIKSLIIEDRSESTYCYEEAVTGGSRKKEFITYILDSGKNKPNKKIIAFREKAIWEPCKEKINFTSTKEGQRQNENIVLLGSNYILKEKIKLNEQNNKNINITSIDDNNKYDNSIEGIVERNLEKLSIKGLEEYPELENKLNELCGILAAEFLSSVNNNGINGNIQIDKYKDSINTKYHKYIDYLTMTAIEDGYYERTGGKLNCVKTIPAKNLIDKKIAEIKTAYSEFTGLLDLLEYAVSLYHPVFSGEMENTEVFNEREMNEGDIFKNSPLLHCKSSVYINTVRDIIAEVIRNNRGKKIKILEVGAGKGKLTQKLIADHDNEEVEYWFTDIGLSFVKEAESAAGMLGMEFMKFSKYDVSNGAGEQEINGKSFDIILAYDVLHAAENIKSALENIYNITSSGGIILIVEAVKTRRWINMTWGHQPGWWSFNDFRKDKLSPLSSLDEWDEIISKHSFSNAGTYPDKESERENTDFGLIALQKEGSGFAPEFKNMFIDSGRRKSGKENKKTEKQYASENENILAEELKRKRILSGKCDKVLICLESGKNVPVIFSDYEHLKNEIESIVLRAETYMNAIIKAGLNQSAVGILFEKQHGRFCAEENIIAEYINAIALNKGIDLSVFFADEDYFINNRNKDIFSIMEAVSNSIVYLTSENADEKKSNYVTQDKEPADYSRPDLPNEFIEPKTDFEKRLSEIWRAMFGINKIGALDNFMELGGDSLMATKIISRIKQDFNVIIKLPVFFQNPTIEGLAEKISNEKTLLTNLTSYDTENIENREEGEI